MQTFNMNSIRSCLLALTVILCQFYLTNGQFGHHSGGIGQFGGGGFNRRGFGSGGFGGGGGHSFGGGGGHGFGGGASIDHREMRGGLYIIFSIKSITMKKTICINITFCVVWFSNFSRCYQIR